MTKDTRRLADTFMGSLEELINAYYIVGLPCAQMHKDPMVSQSQT